MIIIDSKVLKKRIRPKKRDMTEERTSGIKLHIAIDGLPHGGWVTTANVTDRDGAIELVRISAPNPTNVVKVLCDGGYRGENFSRAVRVRSSWR
jgi:hypothetical protein